MNEDEKCRDMAKTIVNQLNAALFHPAMVMTTCNMVSISSAVVIGFPKEKYMECTSNHWDLCKKASDEANKDEVNSEKV